MRTEETTTEDQFWGFICSLFNLIYMESKDTAVQKVFLTEANREVLVPVI